MALREVTDVIADYSGLSHKILEYSLLMKKMIDRSKEPGFAIDSWKPLTELVAVDEFERVGNFKEVQSWEEYLEFLTNWAPTAQWECSFKRITERPDGVVFLELEERSKMSQFSSVVNSVSVYEFNDQGKIRHLDIYLQMELPNKEILESVL